MFHSMLFIYIYYFPLPWARSVQNIKFGIKETLAIIIRAQFVPLMNVKKKHCSASEKALLF